MKEHDVVRLLSPIPAIGSEPGIEEWTSGTIVHIYPYKYPRGRAMEVEFIVEGRSYVKTVFETLVTKEAS